MPKTSEGVSRVTGEVLLEQKGLKYVYKSENKIIIWEILSRKESIVIMIYNIGNPLQYMSGA